MTDVLTLCSAFLRRGAEPAAKQCSLNTIEEYIKNTKLRPILLAEKEILKKVCPMTIDDSEEVAKDALICLINLTDDETGAKAVWDCNDSSEVFQHLTKYPQ